MNPQSLIQCTVLAVLATCAAAFASESAAPATPAQVREGHLSCGGATFTARTTLVDVADHDRQVASQRLQVQSPGRAGPVTLALDARTLRQPFLRGVEVLDASATGWACVAAADGRAYLYVMMTCAESPLRPACEGDSREWVRLYDTRGRALNAGFPHGGSRTPALLRRLRLGGVLADGVSLVDLAE